MFISKKIFLYINYDATINLKNLSNNGFHLITMDVDKELCLTIYDNIYLFFFLLEENPPELSG